MSEYQNKRRMQEAREKVMKIEAVLSDPEIRAALDGKVGDPTEVLKYVQGLFGDQENVFSDRWLKAVMERYYGREDEGN